MKNNELLKLYTSLQKIANNFSLPFDISYGIARNIKQLQKWYKQYLDARETAVIAAGGKCVPEAHNAMDNKAYLLLADDVREQFNKAMHSIETEEYADFTPYKISMDKFTNREDNRPVDLPPALIEPLLDLIITE